MSGVGVGVGRRIHWTGVMGTGLGGRLLGVRVAGTMVTLGDNAGGVSVGTLGDGAGQICLERACRCWSRCLWGMLCRWILSDVGEDARECLDGGELIVAQRCEQGWSWVQESFGECAGGRSVGACCICWM